MLANTQRLSETFIRLENSLGTLLLLSGGFGAVLGLVTATWQAPIEPAQMLMGLVPYESSAVGEFYVKSFSLVNYLTWIFLGLTNSEIAASVLLSVVLGIVSVQTIAMLAFIVLRNSYLSVIVALVAVRLNIFGTGISYPITILGSPHAHGRAGMIVVLYALMFFALSKVRIGFVLAAIAPFVHPGWGVWLNGCLLLVFILRFSELRGLLTRNNLLWYAGTAVSCAGLYLWQKTSFPIPPAEAGPGARELFDNYIRFWDSHRYRPSTVAGVAKGIAFVAITATWAIHMLRRSARRPEEILVFGFLLVAAAVSVPLIFVPSWFDPSLFPKSLIAIMPARYVNGLIAIALPIVLTYIVRERRDFPTLIGAALLSIIVVHFVGPLLQEQSFLTRGELGLLLTGFLVFLSRRFSFPTFGVFQNPAARLAPAALVLGLLAAAPLYVNRHLPNIRMQFRRSVPADIKSRGILTTAEHIYLQAEARAPAITPILDYAVFLDNGLTRIAPLAADIFGVSFKGTPQPRNLHRASIPSGDYELLWERRPCAVWADLGNRYRFDLILAPQDFKLQLPVVWRDGTSTLYRPSCQKS